MRRKPRLDARTYAEGILKKDRIFLSRAITLVESSLQSDELLAQQIINICMPYTGNSFRIGISGTPGVGKSTFIDALGTFLTKQNLQVAVLAIDPSSVRTKGSILGDKTRMERLSLDPKAFIRPTPTGGSLGGVARKTRETLLLCEAAGFDVIIVETVGVGQSEIAVHSMVDFFLLLLLPHAGDDLQGIKRGIMEIADALFVNKADGGLEAKAKIARATFSQAIRLFPKRSSGWQTKVITGSAREEIGIGDIWKKMNEYRSQMEASGYWMSKRKKQALAWMHDAIREKLEEFFFQHPDIKQAIPKLEEDVANQQKFPLIAADELISLWKASGK